jgi:DNA primase catalytic subunit
MDELTRKVLESIEAAARETDAKVNADTRGHVWETDTRGHVIVDGSSDYHNFITCAKCKGSYCIACYDRPTVDCPVK